MEKSIVVSNPFDYYSMAQSSYLDNTLDYYSFWQSTTSRLPIETTQIALRGNKKTKHRPFYSLIGNALYTSLCNCCLSSVMKKSSTTRLRYSLLLDYYPPCRGFSNPQRDINTILFIAKTY